MNEIDHVGALAENVRRLREAHGLSLSQLSERSGVAKATLFKIERGRTNPTLETMVAVAETFDVPVATLIARKPRALVEVVRAGEGEDISDAASDGRVLRSQVIGAGSLEIHAQRFHDGASETSASHGSGAREHVFVRAGRIRLGPVGEEIEAGQGDYATYPADRVHRWEAIGGDAELWIVHTFPRASAFVE
ncbi:XRE family transcriptional regulator [Agrococcus citreus]|uniref:XRE family transcriptional regulator n=1 Tax=Agrococcus citreus TaxID=84643 RepID=A0ABP4JQ83_9MICO